MQTHPAAVTKAFDVLLDLTVAAVGSEGPTAIRERLKSFAVPGLVEWFDEEFGSGPRYRHTTLSNGVVVSEVIS